MISQPTAGIAGSDMMAVRRNHTIGSGDL
jgi:hypothetical protein